jgi:hypothetical protein
MAGLVLLFLPLFLIVTFSIIVLGIFHLYWFIYICIFGPPHLRTVVITLHIVWIVLSWSNGRLYGYSDLIPTPNAWASDMIQKGIVTQSGSTIYHSREGTRNIKSRLCTDMDTALGPFHLVMWGEISRDEEFPTERWALQRLHELLKIDVSLTYAEMWLVYKENWGDRVGFYITLFEYEYQKKIKEHF